MHKLSVVIITFNEEKNIGRCISSVREIADEVIIVDSYSSDNTTAVAASLGAIVYQNKFTGHINQKNIALGYAAHPLILSLDADETIDSDLMRQIKAIKLNGNADGYSMNRLNNYCGKWIRHGAWYPDIKVRLIRKDKGKWGGLNPHDKLILLPESVSGHLKGNILHYSYLTIQEHLSKSKKYAEIGANAYHLSGRKAFFLQLLYKPFFKFIRDYILRLGFMDGYYGFVIALINSREVYLKYLYLLKLS